MKFKSEVQLEALNNAAVDTDKFLVSDSSTVKYRTGTQVLSDIGGQAALTNPITGTGTLNFVSKFTGSTTLGNSVMYDNGTNVGIGTTSPGEKLSVSGNGRFSNGSAGTLQIKHNYGYLQPNWGIKLDGDTGTSGGYLSQYINLGGFALEQGGTYYGGGPWRTDTNSTSYSSVNGVNGRIAFYTNTSLTANSTFTPSERMRIDSSGNVGIGTTSPGARLDVVGNGNAIQVRRSNGYASIKASSDNGGNLILDSDSTGAVFINNYVNRSVYIATGGGNVGIGTTSPSYRLDVNGSAQIKDYIRITNTGGAQRILLGNQDSAGVNNPSIIFAANGNTYIGGGNSWSGDGGTLDYTATFTDAGNVGIGTTSPDVKLEVIDASPTDGIIADFVNSTNAGGTTAAIKLSNADSESCDVVLGANRVGANFGSDFFISLSDSVDGSNQERFRITEAGNVGIGTTSPSGKLTVDIDNSGTVLDLKRDNGVNGRLYITFGAAQSNFYSSGLYTFSVAGSEKMRIDSAGNVGIGTTSASKTLEVAGTGIKLVNAANTHTHLLLDTATYDYKLGDISTSGGAYMQITSSTNQTFIYNSDLILSDGQKITITRSNPADPSCIYVDNTYTSFGTTYNIDSDVSSTLGSRHIGFRYNGTIVGFIGTNGTTAVTYSTTASDERLKKNIEDWQENILDKFEKIEPKEFNFISQEEGEGKTKGFIAQNMAEDFPEAYPHDYSEDKYYSFNPSGMVVYLMKAVKDLVEQNKQLETRIQTLEQQKL